MLPDRTSFLRSVVAVVVVAAIGLLFIASYAGALHDPQPHRVPVAVFGPPRLAAALEGSSALKVIRVPDEAAARRAVDRRDAYGAVIAGEASIEVVVAPAASPAIALLLRDELPRRLRQAGPVHVTTVHPLPQDDLRGGVSFYVAVGLVIAGYLASSLLTVAFGPRPGRVRVAWRMGSVAGLGIVMGVGGALLGHAIGGFGGSWLGLAAFGLLVVLAVGWSTMAMHAALGTAGTGVAILVFVILGNPSSGGPTAHELLPGLWRAVGPLIPTGAGVTGIRDIAYFPAAPLGGPLLVLLVWAALGAAVALGFGDRAMSGDPEVEASMAAAAAP